MREISAGNSNKIYNSWTKMSQKDSLEALEVKLRSISKTKLQRERKLYQVNHKEQIMKEELVIVNAENEQYKEQLKDIKSQISQTKYQISMIQICSTSEKCKIEAHINNLEKHAQGFQVIFEKERELHDQRLKEIQDKEAAELEHMRQLELELIESKEQKQKELANVEMECDALERECAVLKKRNNAIMLKLRRKLLETEQTRREMIKKSGVAS